MSEQRERESVTEWSNPLPSDSERLSKLRGENSPAMIGDYWIADLAASHTSLNYHYSMICRWYQNATTTCIGQRGRLSRTYGCLRLSVCYSFVRFCLCLSCLDTDHCLGNSRYILNVYLLAENRLTVVKFWGSSMQTQPFCTNNIQRMLMFTFPARRNALLNSFLHFPILPYPLPLP